MLSRSFWRNRNVFVTGHTGFKGSWLSFWLNALGARVYGYALPPPTQPSLYGLLRLGELIDDGRGDVRDLDALRTALRRAEPELVFHLAAQPLVRESYSLPVETYATNLMGTVNLLEAVRRVDSVRAVVCVTTDKCYDNHEWDWGYREIDRLGGADPYSSSKACAELAVAAYRRSFFATGGEDRVRIASARAGNVIGGGDWAVDRLVPDILRALAAGERPRIRNPSSVRPWQHVLEPLAGYVLLAERLSAVEGHDFAESWNFGPADADARAVSWIAERLCAMWGQGASWQCEDLPQPHEAGLLRLDSAKARQRLGWKSTWNLDAALAETVAFHKAWLNGDDLRQTILQQIDRFQAGESYKEDQTV